MVAVVVIVVVTPTSTATAKVMVAKLKAMPMVVDMWNLELTERSHLYQVEACRM